MTALYHYIIPTAKNNYRAKLLSTPFLVLITIAVFMFNTVAGVVPATKVYASISSPDLLTLHNAERKKAGLGELKINAALTNSAQHKAEAMLAADCWSHYCPNGESPWKFFTDAGYEYIYAGENLAEGFYNNEDVIVAWMNSPTHRQNMLKPEYTEIGFGIVTGHFQGKDNNIIIVVHFGTPQQRSTTAGVDSEHALTTPKITSPTNGSVFNTRNVTITGDAPGATLVELLDNNNSWITADASQGIFTYNASGLTEETHTLTAISKNGALTSAASTTTTFSVDLTPDSVSTDQIFVVRITEADKLELHITAAPLSNLFLTIDNKQFNFTQSNEALWVTEIPRDAFVHNAQFMINTTDMASNQWSGTLESSFILGQTQNLPEKPQDGRVISATVKSQVNIAFLVLISGLFLLDFLILSYSGVTRKGFKSHLHFAVFIVISIILVTGILNGHVSNGILS